MTHYEVLGVDPSATAETIRRRYLALARRTHPDVVEGDERADAEQRMRAITAAWAVLGDPARRARYDRELAPEQPLRRTPFVPYDDEDDVEERDERFDALRIGDDLTDESIGTGARPPRVLQVLPAGLLAVGIGGMSAGLAASFGPLLVLGLVGLVGSALAFLAAPIWAIFASRRSEQD